MRSVWSPGSERGYALLLALILTFYLSVQLWFLTFRPLVPDEFGTASHIFQLSERTPYVDFRPYKPTLGNYFQLPVLTAVEDHFLALALVKGQMALFVTASLVATFWGLRNVFPRPACLVGVASIVFQTTFLETSADLRTDMLSSALGLLSLSALLGGREFWAGICAGTAVLASQKGVYFVASLAFAFLVTLRAEDTRRRAAWGGLGIILPLAGYYLLWSVIAGPRVVFVNDVARAAAIAQGTPLEGLREFWLQTISRNPVFYLTGTLGIVSAWVRGVRGDVLALRLAGYSSVLVAACVWHKQPWPYFFVFLIPTLGVCITSVLAGFSAPSQDDEKRQVAVGLFAAVLLSSLVCVGLRLPAVYENRLPLQASVVRGLDAMLGPGDVYLAGTALNWERKQVQGLTWLDAPRRRYLAAHPEEVISALRADPPKVIVHNYRLHELLEPLRKELGEYALMGANFALYGLKIRGKQVRRIEFAGKYLVVCPGECRVRTPTGLYEQGEQIALPRGDLSVEASPEVHLVYFPQHPAAQQALKLPRGPLFRPGYYL